MPSIIKNVPENPSTAVKIPASLCSNTWLKNLPSLYTEYTVIINEMIMTKACELASKFFEITSKVGKPILADCSEFIL